MPLLKFDISYQFKKFCFISVLQVIDIIFVCESLSNKCNCPFICGKYFIFLMKRLAPYRGLRTKLLKLCISREEMVYIFEKTLDARQKQFI